MEPVLIQGKMTIYKSGNIEYYWKHETGTFHCGPFSSVYEAIKNYHFWYPTVANVLNLKDAKVIQVDFILKKRI